MNYQDGEVICFDKPLGMTSFALVGKVRWLLCRHLGLKKLKVGHAGTLDPLATGVLVLCTGRATKLIDQLQAHTKEYVATLCVGATTPSFDREHAVDAFYSTSHITRQLVEQTLLRFVGAIEQVPPAFSACKVNGDRAYDLARSGKDVELKPKTLVIDEIELLDYAEDVPICTDAINIHDRQPADLPPTIAQQRGIQLVIRVVCSKGTYIRALARDIGQALGSGAHLTALRRTRVGDVKVENCQQLDSFLNATPQAPLIPQPPL